jgi:hypothetical protein
MSPDAWAAIISLCGVILSVLASSFVMGVRWGKVESKLDDVNSRLRVIEKLFTLKLRKEVEENDR